MVKQREPFIRYNNYIETITGFVKVIDGDGNFIGEMPIKEALREAFSRNLDLVQISQEQMPVCKLYDYHKYKYELSKKNKQKTNKQIQTKTIKITMNIDKNHLHFKLKQGREFLKDCCKVNISARLRGREMSQISVGLDLFNSIVDMFKDEWVIDKMPTTLGREISMTIGGKKIPKESKGEEAK